MSISHEILLKGATAMTKTVHGIVRGRTIELAEDPGVPEGQEVEVQIEIVSPSPLAVSPGLAKIYAILGERYNSGHTDTAERHNEHQP
jgi:hypothetical protein